MREIPNSDWAYDPEYYCYELAIPDVYITVQLWPPNDSWDIHIHCTPERGAYETPEECIAAFAKDIQGIAERYGPLVSQSKFRRVEDDGN